MAGAADLVADVLEEHTFLTRAQLCALTGLAPAVVGRGLARLAAEGRLQRVPLVGGRGPATALGGAGAHRL